MKAGAREGADGLSRSALSIQVRRMRSVLRGRAGDDRASAGRGRVPPAWETLRGHPSLGPSGLGSLIGAVLIFLRDPDGGCPASSVGRPGVCGALAQLGEHLLCKQGVAGSSPAGSTKRHGSVAQLVRAHP